MEEPSDVTDKDEERVLALLLQEEERFKQLKLAAPPEKKTPKLPLGSIVLALEEIDRGQTGLAVLQGEEVTVQAIELIHRYANAIVVIRPNIVKEYGSVSSTIKAPRRAMEDVDDLIQTVDKTITSEETVRVFDLLGSRLPRFIRILVDQDATLEFETPRTERTTFPEGLVANNVLTFENQAWVTFWVTPTVSTSLKVYMSTSSAMGRE